MTKTITKKAWAVVSKKGAFGAIHDTKRGAKYDCFDDEIVVPCTITYELPKTKKP